MKKYRYIAIILLLVPLAVCAQNEPAKKVLTPINVYPPIKINRSVTRHGPEKGSLLIAGGDEGNTKAIWRKFTELAGGKDKAVVVVVTTGADKAASDMADVENVKKQTGITNVTLLHTADLKTANSKAFIDPINQATAVLFVGDYSWKIADSYLNTLTHKAFFDLLNRGGLIAANQETAGIIGSFLWRGDTHGQQITIGDHTQGLGFLKSSAIEHHVFVRNRPFDMIDLIKKSPKLIGIGIDTATAVVIQKDTLSVIGNSFIALYDYNNTIGNGPKHVVNNNEDFNNSDGPFFMLHDGQRYDLNARKVIPPPRRRAFRAGVPAATPTATGEPEDRQ